MKAARAAEEKAQEASSTSDGGETKNAFVGALEAAVESATAAEKTANDAVEECQKEMDNCDAAMQAFMAGRLQDLIQARDKAQEATRDAKEALDR